MASSCPAASATAASSRHDPRRDSTPARTTFRISASAWVCRPRSSNSPAMCWAMPMRTPPSLRPIPSIPIIDLMPDQQGNLPKGGTMRLGAYPCAIRPGTLMERVYGQSNISERHRHRYEFNNEYRRGVPGSRDCASRAPRPTSAWSRRWKSPASVSTSACSSIPNSSPAPTRRIRSSANSSRLRWTRRPRSID